MSDLIKRLREGAQFYHDPITWNEAADRIAELERQLAERQPTAQQVEDAKRWQAFMGAMVADFNEEALTPIQEAIKNAFIGDDEKLTVEEVGKRVDAALQAGKEKE